MYIDIVETCTVFEKMNFISTGNHHEFDHYLTALIYILLVLLLCVCSHMYMSS